MYNRNDIELVRSRVDIVDLIRDYVPSLKATGRSVRGLCPFHHERTPSFHVHPEKGLFKCFGCGEAGDIIAFISKMEQVGFSEAVEFLASRAGITLQKSSSTARQEPEGLKEQLLRLLETASRLYEEQLWDPRAGEVGRNYLKERGVIDDTAQAFHLGLAPSTGTSVFELLVKKGFSVELCQQAGLVTRSNSSGRFYDPLHGRLIFPIFDGFGHVVGFGGRSIPQSKKSVLGSSEKESDREAPKYINSPETPVFSKGKLLYGLYQAKSSIMSSRRAMIVEGYMDVIGVVQGGFPFVVATLGTAFTTDHARMLKRYADEVVAFFDPDEAGQRAALKGLGPLVEQNIYPRVVVTEENEMDDPDEIIQSRGKEYFQNLIDKAPDFLEFILKSASKSASLPLQEKARMAEEALAVIKQSPNEILKTEWTQRVASLLGLRTDSLTQQLNKQSPAEKRKIKEKENVPVEASYIPSAEEEYLQLLMTAPGVWPDIGLEQDELPEGRLRELFVQLQEQWKKYSKITLPSLNDEVSAVNKEWLMKLSLEEKTFPDPIERRDQLVQDIKMKRLRQRLSQLSQGMASGSVSTQEQQEYKDLLRRVKGSMTTKGMVTK